MPWPRPTWRRRRYPVPETIAMPLAKAGPVAACSPARATAPMSALDGQKLDPLVNPPPCR